MERSDIGPASSRFWQGGFQYRFPVLPDWFSNIAPSIPSLLPQPAARSAIRPIQLIRLLPNCAVKTGTRLGLQRRPHHSQHLFMHVDSRYPIDITFPPGGSGERAASSLTRVTCYRPLPQDEETRPIIHSTTHHSGSDRKKSQLLHCRVDLAASSRPICIRLGVIFMSFRGPQALLDRKGEQRIHPGLESCRRQSRDALEA